VNACARQFQQDNFVTEVERILQQFDIRAGPLRLELTESMVLDNLASSVETMIHLREPDVRLSLDDFGTGNASLSCLTQLPLSEIKNDRSFVQNVTSDRSHAIFTRSIIDIGRNFGIEVVTDGIENGNLRNFLLENGCPLRQGYLFSQRVAIKEFELLLGKCSIETL
jgi:EAL domain-containing protein (putative c-di-GMP-specific phosphodiesterase class I)